jgi:hypothetical protein
VFGGDAIEAGHKFVYARIVFHGAGTERVHSQVDGVIPGGEAREVAQDFDLAYFGKIGNAFASMMTAQHFCGVGGWDVQRGQFKGTFSGGGGLEDEALVLINVLGCFFEMLGQFVIPVV